MVGLVHQVAEHERRITVAEEEIVALQDTTIKIQRRLTRLDLSMAAILAHFKIPPPTNEEVEAALEEELNS